MHAPKESNKGKITQSKVKRLVKGDQKCNIGNKMWPKIKIYSKELYRKVILKNINPFFRIKKINTH